MTDISFARTFHYRYSTVTPDRPERSEIKRGVLLNSKLLTDERSSARLSATVYL
jgi:hypothetical protein